MTDMDPYPLTQSEWNEISEISAVRDAWGLQNKEDPMGLAAHIYAAKFKFISGGPGYVGELFILQGDALTGHPPFVLRRGQNGRLLVSQGE